MKTPETTLPQTSETQSKEASPDTCCSTSTLSTCCEPSAKSSCCGTQASSSGQAPTSCGCQ
jgi:hypothetical protein